MNLHSWIWIAGLLLCGGCLFAITIWFISHFSRFRWRTIDDVGDLMRAPDHELLAELLCPLDEVPRERLMEHLLAFGNRRQRRAMLDQLEEQCRRCYHNSLINKDWGATEYIDMLRFNYEGYDENAQQRIRELRSSATKACRDLRLVLIALRFWGLMHALQLDRFKLLSLPHPSSLRKAFGREPFKSYELLKRAIVGMGTVYMDEIWCDDIVARM